MAKFSYKKLKQIQTEITKDMRPRGNKGIIVIEVQGKRYPVYDTPVRARAAVKEILNQYPDAKVI